MVSRPERLQPKMVVAPSGGNRRGLDGSVVHKAYVEDCRRRDEAATISEWSSKPTLGNKHEPGHARGIVIEVKNSAARKRHPMVWIAFGLLFVAVLCACGTGYLG